jgi:hypothetical protein
LIEIASEKTISILYISLQIWLHIIEGTFGDYE